MERYTNLDDIIAKLDKDIEDPDEKVSVHWVKTWLNMQPTADVVPMKEYGQWILCKERLPKEAGKYLVKGTYKGVTEIWKCQFCSLGGIGGWINNARNPIVSAWWEQADVVPMAEVYKIFEKLEEFTYRYLNDNNYTGGDLIYDIAELKKKYTEEQQQ